MIQKGKKKGKSGSRSNKGSEERETASESKRARQMEMKEKQREGTRALATTIKVEETEGHWQRGRNGWKKCQRQKCYCEGRGGRLELKGDEKKIKNVRNKSRNETDLR